MGKKKVIEKTETQQLAEKDKLETAMGKAVTGSGLPDRQAGKRIEAGRIYISATYNNTVITVTDKNGDVIAWVSAGSLGFSGPKKATPFAAAKAAEAISEKLQKTGPLNVDIIVKGVGTGRDSAIRSFINRGFNVLSIRDVTSVPHNGPRPPKVRRV